ncbi:type VI secretion system baseplate subunit TssE [Pseudomonas defluvii]|uniref:type VI secretion system baseplate subunit TssE n=1 Tax=Pseudomonas defluvii TaxID=1876757 RepID=UPI0039067A6F
MKSSAHTLLERLNVNFHAVASPNATASKDGQLSRLREDLSTLLNTCGLVSTLDLSQAPYVSRSVLNYGIDSIAGKTLSSLSPEALVKRIHQAILAYEPRVIRHSLQVAWASRTEAPLFEIQIVIEGHLRDAELAHPFTFRSIWNTQSGAVHIDTAPLRGLHG